MVTSSGPDALPTYGSRFPSSQDASGRERKKIYEAVRRTIWQLDCLHARYVQEKQVTIIREQAKVNQDIVQRLPLFLEKDKVQTLMKQRMFIHRVRIAAAERNYDLWLIQTTSSTKHSPL